MPFNNRLLSSVDPIAARKAFVFTAVFLLLTGWHALKSDTQLGILVPTLLIYTLILINTYSSIRLFASIQPPHNLQQELIDFILGVLYLCMVLTMERPTLFSMSVSIMFVAASLKYAFLLRGVSYIRLLRHKIIVDAIGAVSAFAAFLLILFWHTAHALWLWAVIFALAQIDIFFLHPLYVPHKEQDERKAPLYSH